MFLRNVEGPDLAEFSAIVSKQKYLLVEAQWVLWYLQMWFQRQARHHLSLVHPWSTSLSGFPF
jgi:hypothetical protein